MIYDRVSASILLAMLMNNPAILYNPRYKLSRKDFAPILFHYYLFGCIENIACTGVEEIDANAITAFITSSEKYKEQYQVLKDNDYVDFIGQYKEIVVNGDKTAEFYYNNVKKYSLVRDYKDKGFNIADIYDEGKDESEQKQKLNALSIDEILNHFECIQVELKGEYGSESPIEMSLAGDNTDKLLELFEQTPAMGACLNSPYLTSIINGFNRGHLILKSAPSAFGKSSSAIADLCILCCKKLWDAKLEKWVDNPQYQGKGVYVHCEQDQFSEIQPRFLSYVANVECWRIMNNVLTDYEKKKVLEAGEILKDSCIKIISLPNFTMQGLKNIIKDSALNFNCSYFVFDYLYNNGVAFAELKRLMGSNLREDMYFLQFMTMLKEEAEKYNIGILALSQLNGKEKDQVYVDESCIFGGKSVKNKVEGGCILSTPKKAELELIEPLIAGNKFMQQAPINCVTHVYKARYSKYGEHLKIWSNYNKSTGRTTDMFVTDKDNEPIQVDKTILKGVNLV